MLPMDRAYPVNHIYLCLSLLTMLNLVSLLSNCRGGKARFLQANMLSVSDSRVRMKKVMREAYLYCMILKPHPKRIPPFLTTLGVNEFPPSIYCFVSRPTSTRGHRNQICHLLGGVIWEDRSSQLNFTLEVS